MHKSTLCVVSKDRLPPLSTKNNSLTQTHERGKTLCFCIIRPVTVRRDGTMAPTLRVVLNPENRKELVAAKADATCIVQIWKRGVLQDEFDEEELIDLYEQKHICEYITAHLNGEDNIDLLGGCTSVRLRSHVLYFIRLRDKPFVFFERDSVFEEVNGVPHFRDTYFGLTAWTALCEHGISIVQYLAGPVHEIEWC